MILDDIRRLKKRIDDLQFKVDNFTTCGAIRYDKERVQTSPSGDAMENQMIQYIMDQERLEKMIRQYKKMMTFVNLCRFTSRQQEFIRLFYFQAHTQSQCAKIMNIKISAVCRLKRRVVHNFFISNAE